ncbi:hypothetical protein KR032_001393, partial [Drosophila birchii]
VGERTVKGVIDTGASRSAISRNSYQELREHGRWSGVRAEITLANGMKQHAIGEFHAEIRFGGARVETVFMIMTEVAGGILLGMDFLAKVRSTLRCGNLELEIKEAGSSNDEAREVEDTQDPENTLDERIKDFLQEQRQVFEWMQGVSNAATHKIYLTDDKPIKQRYYLRNPKQQAIIDEQVNELLSLDLIERSRSPYSAPVVLVRKKNNEWRMCIDYRLLNEKTEKDAYPVPRMNFILDQLREAKYISTIDLKAGYWQIRMD